MLAVLAALPCHPLPTPELSATDLCCTIKQAAKDAHSDSRTGVKSVTVPHRPSPPPCSCRLLLALPCSPWLYCFVCHMSELKACIAVLTDVLSHLASLSCTPSLPLRSRLTRLTGHR